MGAIALIQLGLGDSVSFGNEISGDMVGHFNVPVSFRHARALPKWVTPLWVASLSGYRIHPQYLSNPEHALNYGMWLFWLFLSYFSASRPPQRPSNISSDPGAAY